MNNRISDVLDKSAGKAQVTQGQSLGTFLASLTTSGMILVLGIVAYTLLKLQFPEYYYRRAHRISDAKWKPSRLSLWTLLSPMPDPHLKHASGFENYLFDRYLHTLVRIFLPLALTVSPILISLNILEGWSVKGLDRLSFSNIGVEHTGRYWVHLVLALCTVTYVSYILQLELQDYTRLRRTVRPMWDTSAGSTIFLVSNSQAQLTEGTISRCFRRISGGVHSVTINRDYSSLRLKRTERDTAVLKLEVAETNLIRRATLKGKPQEDPDPLVLWMKYLHQNERPTMRLPVCAWLPSLPFIGHQVDAIYYFRERVSNYNCEIELDQRDVNKYPYANSAIVHFKRRLSTPLAIIALKARIPPSWTLKHGTTPEDTIWDNITFGWWQQCTRAALVYTLVSTLVLGFALPVTFIGSLSQIEYLASSASWLRWIGILPSWAVAVIQGVLPPAMLAVITATVPILLRVLANTQGLYSRQVVENRLQIYYFTFLFMQVFLNVSLSAAVTTIISELRAQVNTIPAVLAQNLPKASNYFFSYIMIYTFYTVIFQLVRVNEIVNMLLLSPILDRSPREVWKRRESLVVQNWGTFIPVLTNIACIGLIYSIIAPLILVFSILAFGSLWLLYRFYPPQLSDLELGSDGLFYPTAIRQLFTGIYFMELCLAGLFFLVRNVEDKASCTPQAVIILIATAFTALFHYNVDHKCGFSWLRSMFSKTSADQASGEGGGLQLEAGQSPITRPRILDPEASQDMALDSARPIVWIPRDKLGIADDEIYQLRTCDSISISNEGASLNKHGNLELKGKPSDL